MTADRLLALYDRVAEAPDAVGRLRRFVLDLAVRGKLVGQDPADEPASELLKRIAVEKARLVKAGEIRKPRALKPLALDVDESSLSLPKGWEWAPLAGISYVTMGQSPPGDTYNRSGDGVPLINGPVEFTAGPFGRTIVNQFTTAPTKLCQEGDLLICVRGSTTGRTNVAAFRACIGRGVAAICSSFDDEFIRLFLWKVREDIISMGRGIAFPSVSKKQLENLAIPLPPLAEQRRIVAKVDDLMALCDRLEEARTVREDTRDRLTKASLARLSAPGTDVSTFRSHARFAVDALPALTDRADQIKHLRQTILNLAVRGKLVGHDPADEPALELLKRIAIAKSELKQKTGDSRIRPAHNPNRKDYPVSLPGSWEVQSFENLFLFVDYRGKTPPKTDAGVPLITAKNVRFGSLNREPREFIGQESFKAWMTRGFPQIGDLLFTTEAPMANICLNNIREPFALAQRVICLQPYGDICTRYFMFATMSNLTQTSIKDHSTGLTAKGIKAAKLKPIPIPIPPLVEQHRIVAKVDELMALCDRIEAGLAASDVTRSRLLESLLHDAFRTFSAS